MARASKTGIEIASIKAHDLYGVLLQARGESGPLSDLAIQQKLFAAEDFYERDCNLVLPVTRVFSAPAQRAAHPDATLRVADFDPLLDIAEPAYDYPVGHWDHDRWGLIQLRHRPIRSVTQLVFTWAGSTRVWQVPAAWIGTDAQFGTLQVTPVTGPAVLMSFSAYLLTVLAGGRGLPHAIIVDYVTGYTPEELAHRHQDLLEGIRLRAVLGLMGIMGTIMTGGVQSSSLGLDGLSRSRGFGGKWGAFSGRIELAVQTEQEIRNTWRQREHGLPVVFA